MHDAAVKRCAIYTRKSTEEGLDQEFNSLDAQREACDAYIRSQRHEGWLLLPDSYDDGGYSGGNMERPALQRLLADVAAGRVDTIVVYKVDRLTRALTDFARIVEVLDQSEASFVAVTQALNSTTSMGRLTLNVLLSFAQFEREITRERIRDKIAASKRQGMFVGGLPPLGYDVIDRKLVVNEREAETVRHIFRRYLELGSGSKLIADLRTGGYRSKERNFGGRKAGGIPFRRGALFHLLANPVYVGRVRHFGEQYEGQHASIVDEDLWTRVQRLTSDNRVARNRTRPEASVKLLSGILVDEHGRPMTTSYTTRRGRRYRYYVTHPDHVCTGRPKAARISAEQIEACICKHVATHLRNVETLAQMTGSGASAAEIRRLTARAYALAERVEQRMPESQGLCGVMRKASYSRDSIELELDPAVLSAQLGIAATGAQILPNLRIDVLKFRDGQKSKLVPRVSIQKDAQPDRRMLQLLAEAHSLRDLVLKSQFTSFRSLGAELKRCPQRMVKLIRLSWLAPDITDAISKEGQPFTLVPEDLLGTSWSIDWSEQRFQAFPQSARLNADRF